jgi:hypothetical protein
MRMATDLCQAERRKEARKEGSKQGRKEGRKEVPTLIEILCKITLIKSLKIPSPKIP